MKKFWRVSFVKEVNGLYDIEKYFLSANDAIIAEEMAKIRAEYEGLVWHDLVDVYEIEIDNSKLEVEF